MQKRKFSSFHLGVKKLEYKREKKGLNRAHRDIEKPHNTLKRGEEAAQNRGENRYKTGDKKQRKNGMKIREDWRTPIYSTVILYF